MASEVSGLHLEPGTKIGPIIEIGLASLTWREPIKRPVDILQNPHYDAALALVDLLLRPGELLAHFARCLQNFERFSDV